MKFDDLTPENQVKYLALEKKMFAPKKPKEVKDMKVCRDVFHYV